MSQIRPKNRKTANSIFEPVLFRSTIGATHNAHLYYNCGFIDANEITYQFIDIFISYELLGRNILGIVGDRGGGNEWFLGIQRKRKLSMINGQ